MRVNFLKEHRDIEEAETNLRNSIHPQTHKLLYNEECQYNDYFESRSPPQTPYEKCSTFQQETQLICDKDESSLFFSSKYHQRCT